MVRTIIVNGLSGRFVRFAGIGVLCLILVQQPILLLLVEMGVGALVANAAGFMASALVNYEAQRRLNFGGKVKGTWTRGLIKFMVTSFGSLAINTTIFAAMYYGVGNLFPELATNFGDAFGGRVDLWAWTAAFVGAVGGTGANFVLARTFIFGQNRQEANGATAETEQLPLVARVRALVDGKTLAWFMPAYNEAENLPRTVEQLLVYLRSLGLLDLRIFVINDGSRDNTAQVLDALAAKYDEVIAVHHPCNLGYGGALTTGFHHVVDTGFDLWGFCDSDGQFAPESIGTLLAAQITEDPDMVAGYRLGRGQSDSAWRFYLGRAWHFFGRTVVGRNAEGGHLLSVHDVDCGLKVGKVKSLGRIVDSLRAVAAAISPELISRTNLAGQTIIERGVTHLPRTAGVSTGDNPKVMLRSAINIVRLGLHFRTAYYFGWIRNAAGDAKRSLDQED